MGYIINVNHAELSAQADRMRELASKINSNVNLTVQNLEQLSSSWKGADYNSFINRARSLGNGSSTIVSAARIVCEFADALSSAAELYRKAQAEAINRANFL